MRRSGALFVAIAAAALMPGAVHGAGWVPAQALPPAPEGSWAPRTDIDGRGEVRAVWARLDADNVSRTLQTAARDPLSGSWTAPVTLASGAVISIYELDVNADGDAVVTWTQGAGYDQEVYGRVWLRERGSWSAPEQLSSTYLSDAKNPQAAINGAGTAFVVWVEGYGSAEVSSATLRAAESEWVRQRVSGDHELSTSFKTPDVAAAPDGRAVAAWSAGLYTSVIEAALYSPSGGWQAPTVVSGADEEVGSPAVELDAGGNAAIAWEQGKYNYPWTQVWAATLPAGASWEAPARISSGRGRALYPDVAITPSGVDVAWAVTSDSELGDRIETASRRGLAGAWTSPTALTTPQGTATYSRPGRPNIARRADGAGLIGWGAGSFSGMSSVVRASVRPPDGEWGEGTIVSPRDSRTAGSSVAWTPDGYGLAAWSRGAEGAPHRLELGIYDAVPPEITSLTIPAQAYEDELVSFSVAADDRWAGVGTPRWQAGFLNLTFAGMSETWDYPQPGNYTVRVVVPDTVGNEVVREQAIEILSRPPGPRSVAPSRCRVPRLTGQTLAAARRSLTRANCRLGKVTREWSRARRGRVIRQRPRARVRLARGARVAVVVSRGRRR